VQEKVNSVKENCLVPEEKRKAERVAS